MTESISNGGGGGGGGGGGDDDAGLYNHSIDVKSMSVIGRMILYQEVQAIFVMQF